jgi:osmoprotectant transport system ATP-binding protein
MIEVTNLTKEFNGKKAVDNISFSVKQGETFVLLGTSGCGKTTTLKMINRLIEPTSGNIQVEGKNILEQEPTDLRKGIGYVIQNIGLFPHYTVGQNIAVVPRLLKWKKQDIQERTHELMEMVGLSPPEFQDRYPQELSGGQQQRIGLARAFAADPPIILLDEPFGALDPITRREIQQEFKRLETILEKTLILVTHDVFEAFELGDRICLMDEGIVQQVGTPKELIFSPEKEFVTQFFQTNRFLLELKVFQLQDVLQEMEDKEFQGEPDLSFEESANLLEVVEAMEKTSSPQSPFGIRGKDKKTAKIATTKDLLSAFYKAKSKMFS